MGVFLIALVTYFSYVSIAHRFTSVEQTNATTISTQMSVLADRALHDVESAITELTGTVSTTSTIVVSNNITQPRGTSEGDTGHQALPSTIPSPQPASGPASFSIGMVKDHAGKNDCWTTINQKVYDLTSFIDEHPGGAKDIIKICGRDGTSAFKNQHGQASGPEKTLAEFYIGTLEQL